MYMIRHTLHSCQYIIVIIASIWEKSNSMSSARFYSQWLEFQIKTLNKLVVWYSISSLLIQEVHEIYSSKIKFLNIWWKSVQVWLFIDNSLLDLYIDATDASIQLIPLSMCLVISTSELLTPFFSVWCYNRRIVHQDITSNNRIAKNRTNSKLGLFVRDEVRSRVFEMEKNVSCF
jgi:hypothetical protein